MKPFLKGLIAVILGLVIGILLVIIFKFWGYM